MGLELRAGRAAGPKRAQRDGQRAKESHDRFTARLTIDLTPGLRSRIKIAAFQRGITVAQMLRDLLSRHFPDGAGDAT